MRGDGNLSVRGREGRMVDSGTVSEAGDAARGAGGDVAQLEEHRVRIAGVRGSSPLISTKPFTALPDTAAAAEPRSPV